MTFGRAGDWGWVSQWIGGLVDAVVHFHFSVRWPTLCNQLWSGGSTLGNISQGDTERLSHGYGIVVLCTWNDCCLSRFTFLIFNHKTMRNDTQSFLKWKPLLLAADTSPGFRYRYTTIYLTVCSLNKTDWPMGKFLAAQRQAHRESSDSSLLPDHLPCPHPHCPCPCPCPYLSLSPRLLPSLSIGGEWGQRQR